MRVTVCELPHETRALADAWAALCEHTVTHAPQLVLLPEFGRRRWATWLAEAARATLATHRVVFHGMCQGVRQRAMACQAWGLFTSGSSPVSLSGTLATYLTTRRWVRQR